MTEPAESQSDALCADSTLVPDRGSLGTDDLMNETLYTLYGAVVHLKGAVSSGQIKTCYCMYYAS